MHNVNCPIKCNYPDCCSTDVCLAYNCFIEIYNLKLEQANALGFIDFCFEFGGELFLASWRKHKWEMPVSINKL